MGVDEARMALHVVDRVALDVLGAAPFSPAGPEPITIRS
jgi:hypothetical protein